MTKITRKRQSRKIAHTINPHAHSKTQNTLKKKKSFPAQSENNPRIYQVRFPITYQKRGRGNIYGEHLASKTRKI